MLCNLNVVETLDRGPAVLSVELIATPVNRWTAFEVGLAPKPYVCSGARRADGQSGYIGAEGKTNAYSGGRENLEERHGNDISLMLGPIRCS